MPINRHSHDIFYTMSRKTIEGTNSDIFHAVSGKYMLHLKG